MNFVVFKNVCREILKFSEISALFLQSFCQYFVYTFKFNIFNKDFPYGNICFKDVPFGKNK